MSKKWLIYGLSFIILLAFVLRVYQPYMAERLIGCKACESYKVNEVPPALNWDEISIAYNAYSILKTGKDEWGVFLPIHFKAYGEYKLPVQIYASIPGVALFGLNEMGVRITPVVYGTLTVLLIFFLARAIFQSNAVGLISAFLLSISPWHIHLTRASFESSFAVFWIVLGTWLLVKGLKNSKWIIWSMLPFAISIYTYNSARVFTPLFLASLLFIYRKNWLKMKGSVLLALIVFSALMLPLIPYFFSGERNARYKLVSITDDPGLLPRVNENRGKSTLPEPLPRLIHNKISYTSFYTAENYLAHFNPDFLFISGAPHKQHHVQGVGELYLFQAPFVFLGLYFLFKRKNQFRWLLVSWILLAFIPVSITNDSIPHALRTLIVIPVYQLITALGIYYVYSWFKKKALPWQALAITLGTVTVLVSVGLYLNNYYNFYPKLYSRDWQYGNKQVVDYISKHQSEYDEIVFTRHFGEPHMFTLFYMGYDPAKYQNDQNLVRFETFDWVRVLRFDKYYFPDLGDKGTQVIDIINQNPGKRLLFIGKPGDFPENMVRLAKIDFLNGNKAFEIVENK